LDFGFGFRFWILDFGGLGDWGLAFGMGIWDFGFWMMCETENRSWIGCLYGSFWGLVYIGGWLELKIFGILQSMRSWFKNQKYMAGVEKFWDIAVHVELVRKSKIHGWLGWKNFGILHSMWSWFGNQKNTEEFGQRAFWVKKPKHNSYTMCTMDTSVGSKIIQLYPCGAVLGTEKKETRAKLMLARLLRSQKNKMTHLSMKKLPGNRRPG